MATISPARGLEAVGFEGEERRLSGIGGIGVADLLNAETDVAGCARRFEV